MRRGRKLGAVQNPRDERGWMVPKAGTLRRSVYDAMVAGLGGQALCDSLMISAGSYDGHRAYIVRWRKVQAIRNAGVAAL